MKKKFNLLQVFRGFAALLVVLYHFGDNRKYFAIIPFNNIFSLGYMGVDFFFVLSGFIITYAHFSDLQNRSNKILFLKKRFIKIYPIYWIILTITLILLIAVFKGSTKRLDHAIDLNSFTEWIIIACNYLLITMKYKFYLGIAWTLGYEVFFYLIFFFAISIGFEKSKYLLLAWLLLIICQAFIFQSDSLPFTFIFNSRIIEFLVGCGVAYLIRRDYRIPNYLLGGVFILIVSIFIIEKQVFHLKFAENFHNRTLVAIFNGIIIYYLVMLDLYKNIRSSKLLLLIGDASYSIYLTHSMFFGLLLRIFSKLVDKLHITNYLLLHVVFLVILALVIAGGILSYKFLEVPANRFASKILIGKKPEAIGVVTS